MKTWVFTAERSLDKLAWPYWLQRAWERPWGAVGGFEPIANKPGQYQINMLEGPVIVDVNNGNEVLLNPTMFSTKAAA